MRFDSLSFPYPVLGVHDDIKGVYETQLSVQLTADKVTLVVDHNLNNASIQSLISSKKAAFSVEINCPKTFCRNVYYSGESKQTIEIPSNMLLDKVSADFYIIAVEDIADYKINEAHEDYNGYKFSLYKGDVIAGGKSASFIAEKSWLALKTVSSFMDIQKYEEDSGPMKIDLSRDKITVKLSRNDYERYHGTWNRQHFGAIFHSAIVLPALIYALSQMLEDETGDNYGDKKWFQMLDYRIKNDDDLKNIVFEQGNIAQIAQILLGNPMDRTLSSLERIAEMDSD
jgi:hypothetical protein